MGRKYFARLSWVSLLSVATDVNRGPIGQVSPYRDDFILSSLFLPTDQRLLSVGEWTLICRNRLSYGYLVHVQETSLGMQ